MNEQTHVKTAFFNNRSYLRSRSSHNSISSVHLPTEERSDDFSVCSLNMDLSEPEKHKLYLLISLERHLSAFKRRLLQYTFMELQKCHEDHLRRKIATAMLCRCIKISHKNFKQIAFDLIKESAGKAERAAQSIRKYSKEEPCKRNKREIKAFDVLASYLQGNTPVKAMTKGEIERAFAAKRLFSRLQCIFRDARTKQWAFNLLRAPLVFASRQRPTHIPSISSIRKTSVDRPLKSKAPLDPKQEKLLTGIKKLSDCFYKQKVKAFATLRDKVLPSRGRAAKSKSAKKYDLHMSKLSRFFSYRQNRKLKSIDYSLMNYYKGKLGPQSQGDLENNDDEEMQGRTSSSPRQDSFGSNSQKNLNGTRRVTSVDGKENLPSKSSGDSRNLASGKSLDSEDDGGVGGDSQKVKDPKTMTLAEREQLIKEKLKKVVMKPTPAFKEKQIERYLRYEHTFYQILRVFKGALKRELYYSFENLKNWGNLDPRAYRVFVKVLNRSRGQTEKALHRALATWRDNAKRKQLALMTFRNFISILNLKKNLVLENSFVHLQLVVWLNSEQFKEQLSNKRGRLNSSDEIPMAWRGAGLIIQKGIKSKLNDNLMHAFRNLRQFANKKAKQGLDFQTGANKLLSTMLKQGGSQFFQNLNEMYGDKGNGKKEGQVTTPTSSENSGSDDNTLSTVKEVENEDQDVKQTREEGTFEKISNMSPLKLMMSKKTAPRNSYIVTEGPSNRSLLKLGVFKSIVRNADLQGLLPPGISEVDEFGTPSERSDNPGTNRASIANQLSEFPSEKNSPNKGSSSRREYNETFQTFGNGQGGASSDRGELHEGGKTNEKNPTPFEDRIRAAQDFLSSSGKFPRGRMVDQGSLTSLGGSKDQNLDNLADSPNYRKTQSMTDTAFNRSDKLDLSSPYRRIANSITQKGVEAGSMSSIASNEQDARSEADERPRRKNRLMTDSSLIRTDKNRPRDHNSLSPNKRNNTDSTAERITETDEMESKAPGEQKSHFQQPWSESSLLSSGKNPSRINASVSLTGLNKLSADPNSGRITEKESIDSKLPSGQSPLNGKSKTKSPNRSGSHSFLIQGDKEHSKEFDSNSLTGRNKSKVDTSSERMIEEDGIEFSMTGGGQDAQSTAFGKRKVRSHSKKQGVQDNDIEAADDSNSNIGALTETELLKQQDYSKQGENDEKRSGLPKGTLGKETQNVMKSTDSGEIQSIQGKLNGGLCMMKTLDLLFKFKRKFNLSSAFHEIIHASQENSIQNLQRSFSSQFSDAKRKQNIEVFAKVLESTLRSLKFRHMAWAFGRLKTFKERQLHVENLKIIKLKNIIQKSHLRNLALAFGLWKTDFELRRREFLIMTNLMTKAGGDSKSLYYDNEAQEDNQRRMLSASLMVPKTDSNASRVESDSASPQERQSHTHKGGISPFAKKGTSFENAGLPISHTGKNDSQFGTEQSIFQDGHRATTDGSPKKVTFTEQDIMQGRLETVQSGKGISTLNFSQIPGKFGIVQHPSESPISNTLANFVSFQNSPRDLGKLMISRDDDTKGSIPSHSGNGLGTEQTPNPENSTEWDNSISNYQLTKEDAKHQEGLLTPLQVKGNSPVGTIRLARLQQQKQQQTQQQSPGRSSGRSGKDSGRAGEIRGHSPDVSPIGRDSQNVFTVESAVSQNFITEGKTPNNLLSKQLSNFPGKDVPPVVDSDGESIYTEKNNMSSDRNQRNAKEAAKKTASELQFNTQEEPLMHKGQIDRASLSESSPTGEHQKSERMEKEASMDQEADRSGRNSKAQRGSIAGSNKNLLAQYMKHRKGENSFVSQAGAEGQNTPSSRLNTSVLEDKWTPIHNEEPGFGSERDQIIRGAGEQSKLEGEMYQREGTITPGWDMMRESESSNLHSQQRAGSLSKLSDRVNQNKGEQDIFPKRPDRIQDDHENRQLSNQDHLKRAYKDDITPEARDEGGFSQKYPRSQEQGYQHTIKDSQSTQEPQRFQDQGQGDNYSNYMKQLSSGESEETNANQDNNGGRKYSYISPDPTYRDAGQESERSSLTKSPERENISSQYNKSERPESNKSIFPSLSNQNETGHLTRNAFNPQRTAESSQLRASFPDKSEKGIDLRNDDTTGKRISEVETISAYPQKGETNPQILLRKGAVYGQSEAKSRIQQEDSLKNDSKNISSQFEGHRRFTFSEDKQNEIDGDTSRGQERHKGDSPQKDMASNPETDLIFNHDRFSENPSPAFVSEATDRISSSPKRSDRIFEASEHQRDGDSSVVIRLKEDGSMSRSPGKIDQDSFDSPQNHSRAMDSPILKQNDQDFIQFGNKGPAKRELEDYSIGSISLKQRASFDKSGNIPQKIEDYVPKKLSQTELFGQNPLGKDVQLDDSREKINQGKGFSIKDIPQGSQRDGTDETNQGINSKEQSRGRNSKNEIGEEKSFLLKQDQIPPRSMDEGSNRFSDAQQNPNAHYQYDSGSYLNTNVKPENTSDFYRQEQDSNLTPNARQRETDSYQYESFQPERISVDSRTHKTSKYPRQNEQDSYSEKNLPQNELESSLRQAKQRGSQTSQGKDDSVREAPSGKERMDNISRESIPEFSNKQLYKALTSKNLNKKLNESAHTQPEEADLNVSKGVIAERDSPILKAEIKRSRVVQPSQDNRRSYFDIPTDKSVELSQDYEIFPRKSEVKGFSKTWAGKKHSEDGQEVSAEKIPRDSHPEQPGKFSGKSDRSENDLDKLKAWAPLRNTQNIWGKKSAATESDGFTRSNANKKPEKSEGQLHGHSGGSQDDWERKPMTETDKISRDNIFGARTKPENRFSEQAGYTLQEPIDSALSKFPQRGRGDEKNHEAFNKIPANDSYEGAEGDASWKLSEPQTQQRKTSSSLKKATGNSFLLSNPAKEEGTSDKNLLKGKPIFDTHVDSQRAPIELSTDNRKSDSQSKPLNQKQMDYGDGISIRLREKDHEKIEGKLKEKIARQYSEGDSNDASGQKSSQAETPYLRSHPPSRNQIDEQDLYHSQDLLPTRDSQKDSRRVNEPMFMDKLEAKRGQNPHDANLPLYERNYPQNNEFGGLGKQQIRPENLKNEANAGSKRAHDRESRLQEAFKPFPNSSESQEDNLFRQGQPISKFGKKSPSPTRENPKNSNYTSEDEYYSKTQPDEDNKSNARLFSEPDEVIRPKKSSFYTGNPKKQRDLENEDRPKQLPYYIPQRISMTSPETGDSKRGQPSTDGFHRMSLPHENKKGDDSSQRVSSVPGHKIFGEPRSKHQHQPGFNTDDQVENLHESRLISSDEPHQDHERAGASADRRHIEPNRDSTYLNYSKFLTANKPQHDESFESDRSNKNKVLSLNEIDQQLQEYGRGVKLQDFMTADTDHFPTKTSDPQRKFLLPDDIFENEIAYRAESIRLGQRITGHFPKSDENVTPAHNSSLRLGGAISGSSPHKRSLSDSLGHPPLNDEDNSGRFGNTFSLNVDVLSEYRRSISLLGDSMQSEGFPRHSFGSGILAEHVNETVRSQYLNSPTSPMISPGSNFLRQNLNTKSVATEPRSQLQSHPFVEGRESDPQPAEKNRGSEPPKGNPQRLQTKNQFLIQPSEISHSSGDEWHICSGNPCAICGKDSTYPARSNNRPREARFAVTLEGGSKETNSQQNFSEQKQQRKNQYL